MWEGHFSLACEFPSFQAVSARAWLLRLWEHCRGLGEQALGSSWLLAAGHLPLASSSQGRGHGGPRSGSVCVTRGQLQGLSESNRRGGFSSLAHSSKQEEWRHQGDKGCTVSSSTPAAPPALKPRIIPWVSSSNYLQTAWCVVGSHLHLTWGGLAPHSSEPMILASPAPVLCSGRAALFCSYPSGLKSHRQAHLIP